MLLYVYAASFYSDESKKDKISINTIEVKKTRVFYTSTNGEYIHRYRTRVPVTDSNKILESKYPKHLYTLITENSDVDFFIGLLNEYIQKQSKDLSKEIDFLDKISEKLTNFKKEE